MAVTAESELALRLGVPGGMQPRSPSEATPRATHRLHRQAHIDAPRTGLLLRTCLYPHRLEALKTNPNVETQGLPVTDKAVPVLSEVPAT